MGLGNCPECGRLYMENPARMCQDCLQQEEIDEVKVGEFLRENGNASIEQINKHTGVKEKTILRMMKKGRLIGNYRISYPCELCGELIDEGRLCISCSKGINKQIKEQADKEAAQPQSFKKTGRMYSNFDGK